MQEAQECCTSTGWHREVCNGARCMECCSSSEFREGSEREHLSATGRASASEYVSSPIERSDGSFFVSRVAGATTLGRSVACRTLQRFRIRFKLNSFLVEREC